jgi:3-deoxy-D-manno-octulosonic-acid transferase
MAKWGLNVRFLYSFILYCSIPFALIRLLWKSRRAPAYAKRWSERFALIKMPSSFQHGLWVHSVSVGETLAAIPMIKQIQALYPTLPIMVTTTTPTGSERVQALLGDKVFHVYMPYDLPDAVSRFLRRTQPNMVLIMETELWPNLFHGCKKRDIPIMIANGRLSASSAKGYARFGSLTREMLHCITLLAVQTQEEANRFIKLGMPKERVHVTGSIKFDITIPDDLKQKAMVFRQQWGSTRPVWIAASTHGSEDEIVLDAFAIIKKSFPDALLMLVPRHPERFPQVAALCRKRGYQVIQRSEQKECTRDTEIFLGDTVGELLLFYAASDITFVGGSFVPIGGHNLLEPAALGLPSITGPHLHNFTEISRLLRHSEATWVVHDEKELAEQILTLLQNSKTRHEAGERGRAVVLEHRGALAKHLQFIASLLNDKINSV